MEQVPQRVPKTTKAQYEYLFKFLLQNEVLLASKQKLSDAALIKSLWEEFANRVNTLNLGPARTAERWRRIFVEWKANVKKKRKSRGLTDLENALLIVISVFHSNDNYLPDSLQLTEEATTSRTFQNPPLSPLPSTLLPPSLQSSHTYYQPRSPNNIRKSSVQTEYVEQDNLNIDEDHKEDVQCLINQANGDRIQSIASPQNLLQFDSKIHLLDVKEHPHSKFVDSDGKVTSSPTSGLDNCDGSSTISQTLTTRNEESIAFGEYVGLSLSRMDDYVRTVAIHRISKVIYEADMGMFDKESGGADDKEKPKDSSSTLNTLPLATK